MTFLIISNLRYKSVCPITAYIFKLILYKGINRSLNAKTYMTAIIANHKSPNITFTIEEDIAANPIKRENIINTINLRILLLSSQNFCFSF